MTSSLAQADAELDLRDFDLYAIQVVVREGKPMRLSRVEQRLAVHLMKAKGIDGGAQAYRLGITTDLVTKFYRQPPPIDLDEVPERVMGAKINRSLITREEARLMTGN